MSAHCWPIHTVVTHRRPHQDEIAAIWALQRWGEINDCCRYQGCSALGYEPFDPASHIDERSEDEWLGEGYIFIGVRGGRFDDHPHERFPDDCAFTLMTKHLGINRDPALVELQRHVLVSDRKGSPHPFHLESMVKILHRFLDLPSLLRTVMPQFECYYLAQQSFYEAREITRKGRLVPVTHGATGRRLLLVYVEGTNNEDISRAARSKDGLNAALVVHRNTAGRYYIAGNSRLGVSDLSKLAETVRITEQGIKGEQLVKDRQLLQGDGTLREVPEWYHQREAGQLLNGALTATHVPPSQIQPDGIVKLGECYLRSAPLQPQHNGN